MYEMCRRRSFLLSFICFSVDRHHADHGLSSEAERNRFEYSYFAHRLEYCTGWTQLHSTRKLPRWEARPRDGTPPLKNQLRDPSFDSMIAKRATRTPSQHSEMRPVRKWNRSIMSVSSRCCIISDCGKSRMHRSVMTGGRGVDFPHGAVKQL